MLSRSLTSRHGLSLLSGALRDMPRQRPALDCLDDEEHDGAENAENHDGGERTRAVEGRLARQNDITKPLLAGNELSDDRANQRKRDAYLRPREHARQRIREP